MCVCAHTSYSKAAWSHRNAPQPTLTLVPRLLHALPYHIFTAHLPVKQR